MKLPKNWRYLRYMVFQRDDFQCVNCGSRNSIECDHIIPRIHGGTNDIHNLQTLCKSCHIEKTRIDNGCTIEKCAREWEEFCNATPMQQRKIINA